MLISHGEPADTSPLQPTAPADKRTLLWITFLFGSCGGQCYYLRQFRRALLRTLFAWTLIPWLFALYELCIYARSPSSALRVRYPHALKPVYGVMLPLVVSLAWLTAGSATVAAVLPAYLTYTNRASAAQAAASVRPIELAIRHYYLRHGLLPDRFEQLGPVAPAADVLLDSLAFGENGAFVVTFSDRAGAIAGETIQFAPQRGIGGLHWSCRGGTLDPLYRPASCR